jgi:hypothetical protein
VIVRRNPGSGRCAQGVIFAITCSLRAPPAGHPERGNARRLVDRCRSKPARSCPAGRGAWVVRDARGKTRRLRQSRDAAT